MSADNPAASVWPTLEQLAQQVAGGWLSPLRAAFDGAGAGIWRSGWWTAHATGYAFGLPVSLRLAARASTADVVLTVAVSGYLAPSQVFGGLMFGGASKPTALDFFGLRDPVLHLGNVEAPAFDPEGQGAPVALSPGLLLSGVIPDTSRLDAVPRSLTRPLKYLLDDTRALPAELALHVGSEAVTVEVTITPSWTPLDSAGLALTLSRRQIGIQLARQGSGDVPARDAPQTTERDGTRKPVALDTVTLQTDVDLAISLLGGGLPFPEDDTARLTLGAEITDGGQQPTEADGWLRLRDDARPWSAPFGLPGAMIDALYGRVDLARRTLRAFRGRARFAETGFDVGLVLAPERSGNLVALRNDDDVSLLGVGAALLEVSGAPSIPGPVLLARPARTTDPAADIDPDDYAIYFTTGAQQLDGKAWPPGLRIRGTVRFWSLAEAGVDLGVTWGDGLVQMTGSGLSLKLAGVGCAVDLGGLLQGLPLRVTVTHDLQIFVEADYRLELGGFAAQGTARLDGTGAHFDLPGNGGIWKRDPDIGLTGISTPGGDLNHLRVAAFVAKTISVAVPASPLPNGLASLPGTSISAIGELHFAVDVGTTPSAVGASVTRLVGRIPALGLEKTLDTAGLHVDAGDLASAAQSIESTLRAWAEQVIADLFDDLFGDIPVLGPLLRNAFGLADEALGRVLSVADRLPAGKTLAEALGQAGVALDKADAVIAEAMDWAHDAGLSLGSGVGGWAMSGAGAGLDLLNQALSQIPGFSDTLGEWASDIGGLFRKERDSHPGAEAREAASNKAAEGKVAVLYQQRELGGASFALPLGRYPSMPAPLRPDGDGAGLNSIVLPRGWTAKVYAGEGFTGDWGWIDVTSNDIGDWVDRVRSIEIMRHGLVSFFEDSYYRGTVHKSGHASNYAASSPWLGEASSIMVPRGLKVDLWNARGDTATLTHSTHSVGWQFGGHWNDRIRQANVNPVPVPPVAWQQSSTVASGRTAPAHWQVYPPQKMVVVHVDLRPYGFTRAPRVFTTLAGDMSHYAAYGVNAPYDVTAHGFSVYVGLAGRAVTLAEARDQWRWCLNWVAIADDAPMMLQGSQGGFQTYGSDGYAVQATVRHPPARVDGVAAPALTALRGISSNAFQTGAGASYAAGEGGMEVYIRGGLDRFDASGVPGSIGSPIDPPSADWQWQLDWCRPLFGRAGHTHGGARMHADRTAPGAGWSRYDDNTLVLHVDTADLDRPETIYITAISGFSQHWTLVGGSAVYRRGPGGFEIYVSQVDGGRLTPALARANGWHVHWMAINPA